MRKYKKLLVISLIAGLIYSSFSPLSIGFAQEVVKAIGEMQLGSKPTSDNSQKITPINMEPPKEEIIETKTVASELLSSSTLVKSDPAKAKNRLSTVGEAQDKYRYTSKDIQELFQQGFTIDDLLKSDELGNTWGIAPRDLLKMKKEKQLNWEQIEDNLSKEKLSSTLQKYTSKFSKEIQQLDSEHVPISDQIAILDLVDKGRAPSFPIVLEAYKSSGMKSIEGYLIEDKYYNVIPKDDLDKLGLTEEDVQGLNSDDLKRIEQRTKENGIDLQLFFENNRKSRAKDQSESKEVKP
ncbi:hypothetical protein [Paenibacillus periandrae]|uniref:hypothetical protein n=1 Tax=Paenibacillus periandrae TaxID=1761741 RepID=UPI001F09FC13|nr:hypothetical protein [Paenibacillus periandrae]